MQTTKYASALIGISESQFRKIAKQLGFTPNETKVYRDGNLIRKRHYWGGYTVFAVMSKVRNRKLACVVAD